MVSHKINVQLCTDVTVYIFTAANLGKKTTALHPNQFVGHVKKMHKRDESFTEEFKVTEMLY